MFKKFIRFLILISLLIIGFGCAQSIRFSNDSGNDDNEITTATSQVITGKASYYGEKFHGRHTASGEVYDMNKLTAAHRTMMFGTRLKVTNLWNNRSVIVRVNDRGPFKKGRVLDLSKAAARELDMIVAGVVDVKIEVID
jgi:rare lipoprotein A (peptidoglycan hydrolase)